MITITLTDQEAAAVQRVVDAALKGAGINILVEAGFLQSKLKAAVEEHRISAGKVSPVIDEPKQL